MGLEKIRSAPVSEELKSTKLLSMVKFFGPGAIMASLTIGSGETFFASRGGAVFGYAIIWAFVLGCLFKWVQCYTAMRYLTFTGEHPIASWAHFPGPRGWQWTGPVIFSWWIVFPLKSWYLTGTPAVFSRPSVDSGRNRDNCNCPWIS